MRAKDGISLDLLHQDVLDLQIRTSELLSQLPAEVSECETQAIIKMAAAGTGSHEVLTLLVAEDPLAVLSGRLSLSLSVLERVAQQLEDELSLSADVGPHLTAIIFGTNTTVTIIDTAG
nr:hypothetical protein BaRGS_008517 [Batillaria attramentaria]